MPSVSKSPTAPVVIRRDDFQKLFDSLKSRNYTTIGPIVRDNAIVYDELGGVDDLPIGWIDRQNHGSYHLARNKRKTLFGYNVGPHTWKKFLYPPECKILEAHRDKKKITISPVAEEAGQQAFIGVRSCELHAIAIQDKVLKDGPYSDTAYTRRRENTFIVAVNCTRAGGNCFCSSMNTGPKAQSGFDLALTEVIEDDTHYFVVETGSDRGQDVLNDLPTRAAGPAEIEAAEAGVQHAAFRMGRTLETNGLSDMLKRNFDSLHWDKVGQRCLSCGNCTMVCPTCFCAAIEDRTDIGGQTLERWRKWDSCFTVGFSYIHGGSIRASAKSRYRQWMMHKLAWWPEQFGTFGCVGCGRCIAWCPVGIDLTEEAQSIRKGE